MEIEVSYLSSNYDKEDTIKRIENTNVKYIHVDVMDGIFTENETDPVSKTIDLLKNTNKILDVHLMVNNVKKYVDEIKILNPENITFHIELNQSIDIDNMIEYIHNLGIKAGLAINPDTKIEELYPYLSVIDQILVMSVVPGKGGQSFIMDVIDKIAKLSELKNKYNFKLNIDGGINNNTIDYIKRYNPDFVVSGSFICKGDDYQKQVDLLKS